MQKFKSYVRPLWGFSNGGKNKNKNKKRRKIPKIVATFVCASSHGQHTHSAWTKIELDNRDTATSVIDPEHSLFRMLHFVNYDRSMFYYLFLFRIVYVILVNRIIRIGNMVFLSLLLAVSKATPTNSWEIGYLTT